jgi:hypothetical protein
MVLPVRDMLRSVSGERVFPKSRGAESMGVNKTAAQIRALRQELIAQGAAEERRRIETEGEKASEGKLQAYQAECTKGRDEAYEALNKDQAEYDKQLLAISAGFLGFSLAFIKDIVPLKDAAHLRALYLAFVLIGGCVALVLISYQYSIYVQLRLAEYLKCEGELVAKALSKENREGETPSEETQKTQVNERNKMWSQIDNDSRRVRRLNLLSGGLFLLGVAFLIGFVISNISLSRQVRMPSLSGAKPATATVSVQPQQPTPQPIPAFPKPGPLPGTVPKPPRPPPPLPR